MKQWKRIAAVFTALCMMLGLLPVISTATNHMASSWAELNYLISQASSGDTVYISNGAGEITAGPDDTVLRVSGNKSITLDLNGKTINRNLSAIDVDGHVILVEAGSTLTITDSSGDNSGMITGGWANNGGGVNNQGTLIIEGGTFSGNKAGNGGAIRNYGSLTILGGVFSNNEITGGGGAIWSNGTADIRDAEISGNTGAVNGGAIANHGTMTVSDCFIENNSSSAAGGAIFNGNNGNANVNATVTITGSVISNNSSGLGGGIYIDSNTANLSDTVVSYNTATEKGGGVFVNVSDNAIGILNTEYGSEISHNSAYEGGGIYIRQSVITSVFTDIVTNAVANLTYTDVADNSATADGGGILNTGELNLNGDVNVWYNTCGGRGSGIYNAYTLKMNGAIDIESNTGAEAASANNLYLTAGKVINLTGALEDYCWIGVTAAKANAALTSGYNTYNSGTNPNDIFFTNDGYVLRVINGEVCSRIAQAVDYYDPASKTMQYRENCLVVDSSTTVWENDWYAVTGSVTINTRVKVYGSVNLILCNGAELIVPKGISVPEDTDFTVWGQIEDYIVSEDYKLAGSLYTFSEQGDDLINPDNYHAGIGGDCDGGYGNQCGNITINGGRITAFGGNYGPGIGTTAVAGGEKCITVNNGLIVSYGGGTDNGDTDGNSAAGIGGAVGCTSPRIIINGGGIYAQGSGGAAGIGGGCHGYYRPITITGGEIYAYGAPMAAGIGLGKFETNDYGMLASEVGGGLIDIQGGKIYAVSMLRSDTTYDDSGAFVYGEHDDSFIFKGGVHLYDGAKVTYIKNFVSGGSDPEIVFSAGDTYTEDDLITRVGIIMSSYTVIVEPCDHAGATYSPATFLPQSGHIMHCTTCNLPETTEPHSYDSTGKCTLCGYQASVYILSFNGNGAPGSMDSTAVLENGQAELPGCDFTAPEGLTFAGWSIRVNGQTVTLQPGASVTMDENKTATAVWQISSLAVAAHSLSLNGDIGVNFYVTIPDVSAETSMLFTVDGETVTVPLNLNKYAVRYGVTLYKFTCNVASAQIDTPITVKIVSGEDETENIIYSVHDYLTEAQTSMANDTEFMALVSSLATYGYYANTLFGFNPDFTQHTAFDDSGFADITAASLSDYAAQMDNTADGVSYYGSSLLLRTETAVKHYFTLPAGKTADDFTFMLGTGGSAGELTATSSGKLYYVEIPDIASANLGKAYTVTVLDGDGNAVNTWTYSAFSYVLKVLTLAESGSSSVSEALVNTAKALVVYCYAADTYFSTHTTD